jgi:uncharacterized membrane protein HdeD (DUF308 family)
MDGAGQLDLRTRRGWIWLIVAGFSVLVAGIIVGLQKTGPLCGSPLLPESRSAEIFDSLRRGSKAAVECYRNIDSASVPTWGLIALGVVLVLAAVVIRVININRSSVGL